MFKFEENLVRFLGKASDSNVEYVAVIGFAKNELNEIEVSKVFYDYDAIETYSKAAVVEIAYKNGSVKYFIVKAVEAKFTETTFGELMLKDFDELNKLSALHKLVTRSSNLKANILNINSDTLKVLIEICDDWDAYVRFSEKEVKRESTYNIINESIKYVKINSERLVSEFGLLEANASDIKRIDKLIHYAKYSHFLKNPDSIYK